MLNDKFNKLYNQIINESKNNWDHFPDIKTEKWDFYDFVDYYAKEAADEWEEKNQDKEY